MIALSPLRTFLGRVGRRLTALEPPKPLDPEEKWFWDHYTWAAGEIHNFVTTSGIELEGRVLADVGCGDGIMALGVTHRSRPARLVAYDIQPTNVDVLLERARRYGVADDLPRELEFVQSEPVRIPSEDDTFDVVYTWSAFEHVEEPTALLREIRRVLKPHGTLMLQIWPFYHSSHGSHLWDWFPDQPYHHLTQSDDEIIAEMRRKKNPRADAMFHAYVTLNRITLDELNESIAAAGLEVRKLEVLGVSAHVPREALARHRLSDLGIAGVKLLAAVSSEESPAA